MAGLRQIDNSKHESRRKPTCSTQPPRPHQLLDKRPIATVAQGTSRQPGGLVVIKHSLPLSIHNHMATSIVPHVAHAEEAGIVIRVELLREGVPVVVRLEELETGHAGSAKARTRGTGAT